jgi:hypothetical protein
MPGTAPREPVVVVVLFALSGALSYFLFTFWNNQEFPPGIPFGLVAAFWLVRPWKLWPVSIVLIDLVWIGSVHTAIALMSDKRTYLAMAVAGLIGGLGVAIATGIGCRTLLSIPSLAMAAIAGGLAALPFGWWVQGSEKNAFAGVACFAIWQAAVGTTLWARSSPVRERPNTAPDR